LKIRIAIRPYRAGVFALLTRDCASLVPGYVEMPRWGIAQSASISLELLLIYPVHTPEPR